MDVHFGASPDFYVMREKEYLAYKALVDLTTAHGDEGRAVLSHASLWRLCKNIDEWRTTCGLSRVTLKSSRICKKTVVIFKNDADALMQVQFVLPKLLSQVQMRAVHFAIVRYFHRETTGIL